MKSLFLLIIAEKMRVQNKTLKPKEAPIKRGNRKRGERAGEVSSKN
jgi:hypothetical protein